MELLRKDVFVEGVRSIVREAGPPGSEAVVFVHGSGGSSEDWNDLIPRVASFARVVAVDMPGFGEADRPKGFDYSLRGYARHLGGLLEQLGVERAHLVLHDFGGPWGIAWAAAHPKQAASVTLMGVGIEVGGSWHLGARIMQTPILGELFLLGMTRWHLRLALGLPRAVSDRIARHADWAGQRAAIRLYRAERNLAAMMQALADGITPLRLPALVVWGSRDPFSPARLGEEQRRFFGETEVHVFEGAGHWPFIDDAERAAGLLVPFIQRHIQSDSASISA